MCRRNMTRQKCDGNTRSIRCLPMTSRSQPSGAASHMGCQSASVNVVIRRESRAIIMQCRRPEEASSAPEIKSFGKMLAITVVGTSFQSLRAPSWSYRVVFLLAQQRDINVRRDGKVVVRFAGHYRSPSRPTAQCRHKTARSYSSSDARRSISRRRRVNNKVKQAGLSSIVIAVRGLRPDSHSSHRKTRRNDG